MPGLNGKARSTKQPRPNIATFSTSTFGAFSIRFGTKFRSCSRMAAAPSSTIPVWPDTSACRGVSVYIASKHAVEGLTKSVALEFAKQNIRVNAIAPGVIATEMWDRFAGDELRDQVASIIPVARVGASEEIAAAVLYLCSDNAKFTTGTSLVVDGGFIAQ